MTATKSSPKPMHRSLTTRNRIKSRRSYTPSVCRICPKGPVISSPNAHSREYFQEPFHRTTAATCVDTFPVTRLYLQPISPTSLPNFSNMQRANTTTATTNTNTRKKATSSLPRLTPRCQVESDATKAPQFIQTPAPTPPLSPSYTPHPRRRLLRWIES